MSAININARIVSAQFCTYRLVGAGRGLAAADSEPITTAVTGRCIHATRNAIKYAICSLSIQLMPWPPPPYSSDRFSADEPLRLWNQWLNSAPPGFGRSFLFSLGRSAPRVDDSDSDSSES